MLRAGERRLLWSGEHYGQNLKSRSWQQALPPDASRACQSFASRVNTRDSTKRSALASVKPSSSLTDSEWTKG